VVLSIGIDAHLLQVKQENTIVRLTVAVMRRMSSQITPKVCISSIPQGIAYHQNEVLYIIIPKAFYAHQKV
jgi:hypothetical protein